MKSSETQATHHSQALAEVCGVHLSRLSAELVARSAFLNVRLSPPLLFYDLFVLLALFLFDPPVLFLNF